MSPDASARYHARTRTNTQHAKQERPMADPATNPSAEPTAKPMIAFDDFARVDLRIARITHAEPHPNADRLLRLQLDDGSGEPRQICAGIRGAYDPDELVGRLIVIVANLEPRTIRGEESRGMLLAASSGVKGDDDRRVVLLTPMAELPTGSIVS